MIKINIVKDGIITNSAIFESLELAEMWIKREEEVKSFGEDYKVEIIEDYIDQDKINDEARKYLASTDYMIIRKLETGKEMPTEILTERQSARERIK